MKSNENQDTMCLCDVAAALHPSEFDFNGRILSDAKMFRPECLEENS